MEAEGLEVCSLLPRMVVRGSQAETLEERTIFFNCCTVSKLRFFQPAVLFYIVLCIP